MDNFAEGNGQQMVKPPVEFFEALKICFKKYAVFKGRARRSE